MFFRNLQIFRLAPHWAYSIDQLTAALERRQFVPCGAQTRRSRGWVPPTGENGVLVFSVGHQQLIALGIEEKVLPRAVVRQYAEAKLAEIEEAQGYKPGRKQALEVREQMELDLLPNALKRRSVVYVWIDPQNRWLIVDAASSARADEIVEELKASLGELPLMLLKTAMAPGTAMTGWLASSEAPGGFTIDRDCELQAQAEERATVRYTRHNIDIDEVRNHIAQGKTVSRLAMTWNDRTSFVLTEQMQIKRISFLDIMKEDAERQAQCADDLFAANFSIMSGELARMLDGLVAALGGASE